MFQIKILIFVDGGEILAQRGSVFGNCLSLQSLKNAENCPARWE